MIWARFRPLFMKLWLAVVIALGAYDLLPYRRIKRYRKWRRGD